MALFEWLDRSSPAAETLEIIFALLAMGIFVRLSRDPR